MFYQQDKGWSEKQSRQKDKKKEEALVWFKRESSYAERNVENCSWRVEHLNPRFAGDNQIHSVLMGMSGRGVIKDGVVKKPSGHGVVP